MSISSKKLNDLPVRSGVYYFLGARTSKKPNKKGREVLYIGKAASLKSRVRSYFRDDITESRGPGIVKMVADAEDIAYEESDSVLEAVILEARRIREYHPKYNVREKDDKSFNYIVITDEDFPRVLLVREREIASGKFTEKTKHTYGPFPHGGTLREALAIIRKIFPYRDSKCTPNQDKPCFNAQIGLCPGVCTGEISKQEYRKQIRRIEQLLSGKRKSLITSLKRDMNRAAREKRFERAAEIRNQINALEHIQDVALIKHEEAPEQSGKRIEAYDIAHTGGGETVGVMAVVVGGSAQKDAYRKFTVRAKTNGSDTDALREVLERRLNHDEWQWPSLVVVDGGTAQRNVARRVLEEYGMAIPIVGVVKDEYHKPKRIDGDKEAAKKYERAILLANSEAHRFALSFHRERRGKASGIQKSK